MVIGGGSLRGGGGRAPCGEVEMRGLDGVRLSSEDEGVGAGITTGLVDERLGSAGGMLRPESEVTSRVGRGGMTGLGLSGGGVGFGGE